MVAGCRGTATTSSAPRAASPTGGASLEDRIAHELLEASPVADPSNPTARDAAGERLSRMGDLLDAAGDRILWGGFDPGHGYDPAEQHLTEFSPFVWAKVYLSTFTFLPSYEVRHEGRFTVLAIDARFRSQLDAGDYPYPFWHSAKKWVSYVNTRALLLVFDKGRLLAVYRRSAADEGHTVVPEWNSKWRWTDAHGRENPRAMLFTYLLSPDNPWLTRLDDTYRTLEKHFRENHCVTCHAPDNPGKANPLLLLDFPNQALAARHSLVATLREDAMPPATPDHGRAAGLGDENERQALLALAVAFERDADAALAFEKGHASHAIPAADSAEPPRH
jgi:hypothetical protein